MKPIKQGKKLHLKKLTISHLSDVKAGNGDSARTLATICNEIPTCDTCPTWCAEIPTC
jgi:hypothetical protein